MNGLGLPTPLAWAAKILAMKRTSLFQQSLFTVPFLVFAATLAALATFASAQATQTWRHLEPVSLFNGSTLAGWQSKKGETPPAGWEVSDGCIHWTKRSGDLFWHQKVVDFELSFEWKIAKGANSGVKYRVRDYGKKTLGCEYQVFDDQPNAGHSLNATGSIYALCEPNQSKKLNPPGEWNRARIVVRGNLIEHWLNGRLVAQADTYSGDWWSRLMKSKFSDHQSFGQPGRGRIMLQDHGGEVWYRSFELVPLERLD